MTISINACDYPRRQRLRWGYRRVRGN